MSRQIAVWVCAIQGCYFLATGVWPLVSIESFQLVTGRKTDHLVTGNESDHWLVNTVAVLVIAIAVVLLFAAARQRISTELALLALTSSTGLAAIDIVYAWRGVISPVYLIDAVVELFFIVFWLVWLWQAPET
jgi:hypothetical protein